MNINFSIEHRLVREHIAAGKLKAGKKHQCPWAKEASLRSKGAERVGEGASDNTLPALFFLWSGPDCQ